MQKRPGVADFQQVEIPLGLGPGFLGDDEAAFGVIRVANNLILLCNIGAAAPASVISPVDAVLQVEAIETIDTYHGFTGTDVEIFLEIDQRADREPGRIKSGGGVEAVDQETADAELEALGRRVLVIAVVCISMGQIACATSQADNQSDRLE